MSDPLTFTHFDTDDVECDLCGRNNRVTVRTDIRTGYWEWDSFTCVCGERHTGMHGTRDETGATGVLGSLFLFGLAITLIGCGVGSDALIIAGAALMVPAPTIGAIAWIERNLS